MDNIYFGDLSKMCIYTSVYSRTQFCCKVWRMRFPLAVAGKISFRRGKIGKGGNGATEKRSSFHILNESSTFVGFSLLLARSSEIFFASLLIFSLEKVVAKTSNANVNTIAFPFSIFLLFLSLRIKSKSSVKGQ